MGKARTVHFVRKKQNQIIRIICHEMQLEDRCYYSLDTVPLECQAFCYELLTSQDRSSV